MIGCLHALLSKLSSWLRICLSWEIILVLYVGDKNNVCHPFFVLVWWKVPPCCVFPSLCVMSAWFTGFSGILPLKLSWNTAAPYKSCRRGASQTPNGGHRSTDASWPPAGGGVEEVPSEAVGPPPTPISCVHSSRGRLGTWLSSRQPMTSATAPHPPKPPPHTRSLSPTVLQSSSKFTEPLSSPSFLQCVHTKRQPQWSRANLFTQHN